MAKARAVRVAVAHQEAAGVVGHVHPLVEVEGERVGALDAGEARRAARGSAWRARRTRRRRGTRGPPRGRGRRALRDRRWRRCSTVPAVPTTQNGSAPARAVGGDRARAAAPTSMRKSASTGRGAAPRVPRPRISTPCATQPCASARGVARRGAGAARARPLGADVAAGRRVARDGEPDEVGHRGAGDENAARALREAEELPAPADHLAARRRRAACSRPPQLGFIAAASSSASDPGRQCRCRGPSRRSAGWMLPVA